MMKKTLALLLAALLILALAACGGGTQPGGNAAPHAWFVGFLEKEDAPYAFVAFIENGGSGSANAGTLANKVLQSAIK